MNFKLTRLACITGLTLFTSLNATAAPLVFSGTGATTNDAFNTFRSVIGSNSRITWDGVRLNGDDANPNTKVIDAGKTVAIPEDRFRGAGAIYEEPYAVSGDGFASVNPGTAGQFPAFSGANTFVMFDDDNDDGAFNDRFIEQTFVIPGTNIVAGTRGFGAIFLDNEIAGASKIEYFGTDSAGNDVSLGVYDVPVGKSGEAQFLGVLFDSPIVTEVKLTVGTNALFSFDGATFKSFGQESLNHGIDLVATDDFVFATPVAFQPVPVPAAAWLMLSAFPALFRVKRSGQASNVA